MSAFSAWWGSSREGATPDPKSRNVRRERAAFIAGMRHAAEIVDDSDTVEMGSGYVRQDDARGTLVAARDAIRAAADKEEASLRD